MAGHRNIGVLREQMGPKRVAKAKSHAKNMQAQMLLAELRKLEGVTQVELAQKLGIKQPAVSQLVREGRGNPASVRKAIGDLRLLRAKIKSRSTGLPNLTLAEVKSAVREGRA